MTDDQLVDLQTAVANLHDEDAAAVTDFVMVAAARYGDFGSGLLRQLIHKAFDAVQPRALHVATAYDGQWIKKTRGVLMNEGDHAARKRYTARRKFKRARAEW